jgi:hypothetical protein
VRAARRVGCALVVLACPAAVAAQSDTRVAVTDTLAIDYRVDNRNGLDGDDDYGSLVNRLNVTGNSGALRGSARLDVFGFFDAPDDRYRSLASLERIQLGWHRDQVTIEVGDTYQQLGRGIALSMRKIDEAGVDVAIRGGSFAWAGDVVSIRAFGGLANPSNADAVNQRYVRDTDDLVVGGAIAVQPVRSVRVEAFGAFLRPEESRFDDLRTACDAVPILCDDFTRADEEDGTTSLGVAVTLPTVLPWLSWYAEGGYQLRDELDRNPVGQAGYTAVDLSFGTSSVLLEGLFLDDWTADGSPNTGLDGVRFRYNQPPTLERIDQEVPNNEDVRGGRARWEHWFIAPDVTVHANVAYRVNDAGEEAEVTQIHGYGGIEKYYALGASRVSVSGGYRDERQPSLDDPALKDMQHAEADWIHAFGTGWSTHVTSNLEVRTLAGDDYLRGSTFVGLERVGLGALTFELGYDTQDERDSTANLFYAGIAKWEISDHFTLTATGGTQRGGLKCVNGVCRVYPGFAGGRVELISRF